MAVEWLTVICIAICCLFMAMCTYVYCRAGWWYPTKRQMAKLAGEFVKAIIKEILKEAFSRLLFGDV